MVSLSRAQVDEIIAHAKELPKEEICGVLGGRDNRVSSLYRAQNAAPEGTRRTRFEMEPRDMLRAMRAIDDADLELIGFYHSHTHTRAYPSPTDVDMWIKTWAGDALCFICSLMEPDRPDIHAFHIDSKGAITEEPISIE